MAIIVQNYLQKLCKIFTASDESMGLWFQELGLRFTGFVIMTETSSHSATLTPCCLKFSKPRQKMKTPGSGTAERGKKSAVMNSSWIFINFPLVKHPNKPTQDVCFQPVQTAGFN